MAGRDDGQHLPAGRQVFKRRPGSAVNARSYWAQCRALMLKAVAHNILILYAPTQPLTQAA